MEPGWYGNIEPHKVRGFLLEGEPRAGSSRVEQLATGWGEPCHTQSSRKVEEGPEVLLCNLDLSMVHIGDDRQDVVVRDYEG
jgi:hypothetical protein